MTDTWADLDLIFVLLRTILQRTSGQQGDNLKLQQLDNKGVHGISKSGNSFFFFLINIGITKKIGVGTVTW